jgi:hypothetical protein
MIAIELPEEVEERLRTELGPDLGGLAKEALLLELYRRGKASGDFFSDRARAPWLVVENQRIVEATPRFPQ